MCYIRWELFLRGPKWRSWTLCLTDWLQLLTKKVYPEFDLGCSYNYQNGFILTRVIVSLHSRDFSWGRRNKYRAGLYAPTDPADGLLYPRLWQGLGWAKPSWATDCGGSCNLIKDCLGNCGYDQICGSLPPSSGYSFMIKCALALVKKDQWEDIPRLCQVPG